MPSLWLAILKNIIEISILAIPPRVLYISEIAMEYTAKKTNNSIAFLGLFDFSWDKMLIKPTITRAEDTRYIMILYIFQASFTFKACVKVPTNRPININTYPFLIFPY